VILSEETVAIDVIRKLRELVAQKPEPDAFLIRVNPRVAAKLTEEGSGLHELEEETGKDFHFEGGDALAVATYEVSEEGSRDDIERRALPFSVGEEVLVAIEEPHMYNVDDAIARVDSYIVSVTGGGRFVGERRLVRIDEVARSQASASLVDGGPEEDGDDPEGDDGELESAASGRRRRGRRGGRNRPRASDGATTDG
jgi:ribonuclease G